MKHIIEILIICLMLIGFVWFARKTPPTTHAPDTPHTYLIVWMATLTNSAGQMRGNAHIQSSSLLQDLPRIKHSISTSLPACDPSSLIILNAVKLD